MTASSSSSSSSPAPAPPEFQAVVLASGKGSRFADLAAQKAKCLLPIANLPMIWYPLNMLQKIGFQDVIVVAPEHIRSELMSLPKRTQLDLRLDIVSFPAGSSGSSSGEADGSDEELGTADALRLVHDRLRSDRVMVVSSDLVTDVSLHQLTDLHRVHQSAVTALFAKTAKADPKAVQVPGPKSKLKKEKDLVGLDMSTHQLCYLSSEADLDEFVSLKRSLLKEHPRLTLMTNLMDAHFYIMEKWVCDFIAKDETFSSIKGEVIPYLVKKQFSRRAVKKTHCEEDDDHIGSDEIVNEITSKDDLLFSCLPSDPMAAQFQHLSNWTDHTDLGAAYHSRSLRCYAVVVGGADGGGQTCARANNLHTYCDLNRQGGRLVAAHAAPAKDLPAVHPGSKVEQRAQVDSECLIGDQTHVSGKTTLKQASLGRECCVEEKVHLTNSVLMDHVTLKEGCKVTGSLLCDGVVIKERCDIRDCIVGRGYTFKEGAKHSNEILVEEKDRMMEID